MKSYPSIPGGIIRDLDVWAFDKLDGSNIRAEWTRKHGTFSKFGSRTRLLDKTDLFLGESVELIKSKYEVDLAAIFRDQRYERAICFFEFFGPNSFAGYHEEEAHDVILFDVNPHKKGITGPRDFVDVYGHLDIPRVLHRGKVGPEFESQVRDGILEGMTFEGVVCKVQTRSVHDLKMFKIKNQAWYDKLKGLCGDDEKKFESLR